MLNLLLLLIALVAPIPKPIELEFYATPEQQEIIECDAPIQILNGGRRWGKTLTGNCKTIKVASQNPGEELWYVSPSNRLARKQYDMYLANKTIAQFISKPRTQPQPCFQLFDAVVTFRSAHKPDLLVGDGLVYVHVDEPALMKLSTITEKLMPALSDRNGTLFLTGTFRGKNWFYQWYQDGQKHGGDKVSWSYPTPTGMAFQGAAGKRRLELLKSTMTSGEWEQECLCLPSANNAAAFKHVSRCISGESSNTPKPRGRYLLGWDTGKAETPSAIVLLDVDTGHVPFAEKLPLGMDYPLQMKRVLAIARLFQALVIVDSTGAGTKDAIVDFARERLTPHGLHCEGVQFRGSKQEAIVKQLDLDLQLQKLQIPAEHTQLLHELTQFEYDYTEEGYRYYHAPEGEFCDLVAALAMCTHGRAQGWAPDRGGRPLVMG